MKMNRIYHIINGFVSCLLAGLLFACSDEVEAPLPEVVETIEVPLSFNLLDVGTLTTRTVSDEDEGPSTGNSVRPVKVNQVKVYVYCRDAGGDYRDNVAGFVKDGREYVFPVVDTGSGNWPRYIASGSVQMSSDKEYRIMAVAYDSEEVKSKPFLLENDRFDHATFVLRDVDETDTETEMTYNTPELFFGGVLWNENDTLFTYENVKDSEAALSGWLHRGVAGIGLTLNNVPEDVEKIELLADGLYTKVYGRYYSDFLYAYDWKDGIENEQFVLGELVEAQSDDATTSRTFKVVGPNLLTDVCTTLRVRITKTDKMEYARLRLKETGVKTKAVPPDDGPGIGIIPDSGDPENPNPEDPEDPDPEAPYRVCFKRNNYYEISGDYNKLMTRQYTLRVTVNPYWDADVSLSLDKVEEDGTRNP